MTSGPDPKLCRDTYALDYEKWADDEIKLKHNGDIVATLGYGFRDFSKCLTGKGVHEPYTEPVDSLIHRNDQSRSSDGPLIPSKEKPNDTDIRLNDLKYKGVVTGINFDQLPMQIYHTGNSHK